MRIRLLAVGRLRDGAERTLLDDYLLRARRAGGGLGVRDVEEVEVAAGGGRDAEGVRLLARLGAGPAIALDERGEAWTSVELSRRLARWRDSGEAQATFVIGGADGLSAEVLERARGRLALGGLTWPHRLARVMIAEQIYRALSIEAGAPYHRE